MTAAPSDPAPPVPLAPPAERVTAALALLDAVTDLYHSGFTTFSLYYDGREVRLKPYAKVAARVVPIVKV